MTIDHKALLNEVEMKAQELHLLLRRYFPQIGQIAIEPFVNYISIAILDEILVLLTKDFNTVVLRSMNPEKIALLADYELFKKKYHQNLANFFSPNYDQNEMKKMMWAAAGMWALNNLLETEYGKNNNLAAIMTGQLVKMSAREIVDHARE